MTCPYCRGKSPEKRNPRRCWGCGAQMKESGPTFLVDTSLLQQQNYAAMQNMRAGQMYGIGGDYNSLLQASLFAIPSMFPDISGHKT